MIFYDIIPPEKIKKIAKEVLGIKEYKTKKERVLNIGLRISIFLFLILFSVFNFTPLKISLGFLLEEREIKIFDFYPFLLTAKGENFEVQEKENEMGKGVFENRVILFSGGKSELIIENFKEKDFAQEAKIIKENFENSKETNENDDFPPEETKDAFGEEIKEVEKEIPMEEAPEEIEIQELNENTSTEASFFEKIKKFFENRVFAQEKEFLATLVLFVFKNGEKENSQFLISFSLDGENWENLGELNLGKKTVGFFEFELPFLTDIEEIKNLRIKIESQDTEKDSVYFESVFLRVILGKSEKLNPANFDFEKEKIKKIVGITEDLLVSEIENENELAIYLLNLKENTKEKISGEKTVDDNFPIGIKDGWIFWLSENKSKVFAFCLQKKELLEKTISFPNCESGERLKIDFSGIDWTVIIDCHNFYFFNEKIGEIFSDGNSKVLEFFKKTFKLEEFLDKEELSNLGFSIENRDLKEVFENYGE